MRFSVQGNGDYPIEAPMSEENKKAGVIGAKKKPVAKVQTTTVDVRTTEVTAPFGEDFEDTEASAPLGMLQLRAHHRKFFTTVTWTFRLSDLGATAKDNAYAVRFEQAAIDTLLGPVSAMEKPEPGKRTPRAYVEYAALVSSSNDSPWPVMVDARDWIKKATMCCTNSGMCGTYVIMANGTNQPQMKNALPIFKLCAGDAKTLSEAPTAIAGVTIKELEEEAKKTDPTSGTVQFKSASRLGELYKCACDPGMRMPLQQGDVYEITKAAYDSFIGSVQETISGLDAISFANSDMKLVHKFVRSADRQGTTQVVIDDMLRGYAGAPEDARKAIQNAIFTVCSTLFVVCRTDVY